jgi:RND superfamily putative drug exporter
MLIRLSDLCFRRRTTVVAVWCAVLIAAIAVLKLFPPAYHADYQTPGAEATKVFDLLSERFAIRKGDCINIVFSSKNGLSSPSTRDTIWALLASVASFPHVMSVAGPFDPAGAGQTAPGGAVAFAVVNLDRTIDKLSNLDAKYQAKFLDMVRPGMHGSLQVEVTNFVYATTLGNETLALAFAAIVLLIAFGSLVATGLPIITALFGLGVGAAIGGCLTHLVATPDWAATVATMIGLGVGVDYSLFIVTRYRRALSEGLGPRDAVGSAMATAGRAVLFAGGVVVLSLLGMLTMQLEYMDGVLCLSITAVVLMLATSHTLLPALLGFVGTNIDKLHLPFLSAKTTNNNLGMWYRWSRAVQKRPWLAFFGGATVLALLTLPVCGLRLGLPDDGNHLKNETSRRAYDLLTQGFGPGFNGPLTVLVDTRGAASSFEVLAALPEEIRKIDGVASVSQAIPNPERDAAIINVYPATSPQAKATERLVKKLRRDVIPALIDSTGMKAYVGGFTAISLDQADYIMQRLPWFIGAVAFLSFFLLTVVFRSPVVAFKAGVMNVLAIAAAYGVMAYAVNDTWLGHLLHIPETPVPAFVPMIMFAVLFGLSMDYEVFLLSRIREEYERSGNNSDAVANGLAMTGRVISAAAAIMVFVFSVFILDPNVFIKQIGLGLTVAVLVDATVVRIVLVPAAMELLGNANWWTPRWLDKILPHINVHQTAQRNSEEHRPL